MTPAERSLSSLGSFYFVFLPWWNLHYDVKQERCPWSRGGPASLSFRGAGAGVLSCLQRGAPSVLVRWVFLAWKGVELCWMLALPRRGDHLGLCSGLWWGGWLALTSVSLWWVPLRRHLQGAVLLNSLCWCSVEGFCVSLRDRCWSSFLILSTLPNMEMMIPVIMLLFAFRKNLRYSLYTSEYTHLNCFIQ